LTRQASAFSIIAGCETISRCDVNQSVSLLFAA
jgi:hypothetical protein